MQSRTRRHAAAAATALGVLLLLATTITVVVGDGAAAPSAGAAPSPASTPAAPAATPPAGTDSLSKSIANAQSALKLKPNDADAWATLGSDYVQQGRITADPTYYPKSQAALARSITLKPEGT